MPVQARARARVSGRLPLSVVVSAVTRLGEAAGATLPQVERAVRCRYPTTRRAVRAALDRAVNEGFLGLSRRRYLPVCYKCCRRREPLAPRQPRAPPPPQPPPPPGDWNLSRIVPAFLGDLFQS